MKARRRNACRPFPKRVFRKTYHNDGHLLARFQQSVCHGLQQRRDIGYWTSQPNFRQHDISCTSKKCTSGGHYETFPETDALDRITADDGAWPEQNFNDSYSRGLSAVADGIQELGTLGRGRSEGHDESHHTAKSFECG